MNVLRKKLSIAVLLSVAMIGAAHGRPGQSGDGGRPEPRDFRNDARQQDAGRRPPEPVADPARRGGGGGGRMSPEERRNLRRQINEAGQDIYAPRR